MARELLKMATAAKVSDAVKLSAIRDALDRAGLDPKTGFEVDVALKPYEHVLTNVNLQGGSRADWRRAHGTPVETPRALPVTDPSQPVDAEVIDVEQDETDCDSTSATRDRQGRTITPDGDDAHPDARSAPYDPLADQSTPIGPSGPEDDELLTLDEAVIRVARINNMATAGHARLRRPQRALPRGVSSR